MPSMHSTPLPMVTRGIPTGPQGEIAADFFTLNHKDYLSICNTFSKYPFLFQKPKKIAEATIPRYQQHFAQNCPGKTFLQTRGIPFCQKKCTASMMQQEVQHIPPSQHYHQSNGFIEWSIKSTKENLTKGYIKKHTLHNVLYHLRSNLIALLMPSPREILHNRMDKRPSQSSTSIDIECIWNFLIDKKTGTKRNTIIGIGPIP